MFWASSSLSYFLLKDDIFFSQPPTHDLIQSSLALHQSLAFAAPSPLNIKQKTPSPNLSPVTSPSGLLYDHEPLFDGLEDLDLSQPNDSTVTNNTNLIADNDDTTTAPFKRLLNTTTAVTSSSSPSQSPSFSSSTPRPTVFESLTDTGVDWCRYCGTTESVNWRPGPWGKRTLCNKHGCDYKGYGLVSRLPRLDLSAFVNEPIQDRICPVIQEFCAICRSPGFTSDNLLVKCQGGCSRAYHQLCRSPIIGSHLFQDTRWYCSSACRVNRLKNRVVVDLPRNHLPLMIRNQKRH
ncbi:hypothetical protein F4703DRAFT_1737496 [Phycomyces blakesleeanus]